MVRFVKHDLFIETLMNEFRENRLSHAFLVQTNNIDDTFNSIIKFVKVINCPLEFKDNCLDCNLCKQIDTGNLPSLIVIEPDGNVIKKEQLIDLMDSFKTKPVFSKYNVYIIRNAEMLNASSANTILKFLEEPEDDIIGFFITNNKDNVLDTVQSRCHIMQDYYVGDVSFDDELLEVIYDFLKHIGDDSIMYNKNVLINKITNRMELVAFLKNMFYLFEHLLDVCLLDSKLKYDRFVFLLGKDKSYYIGWLNLINKYLNRANYNVNILLCLDALVLEGRILCYNI